MQTPSPERLEILDDVVIEVEGGLIVSITDSNADDFDEPTIDLGNETVLLPGLVDSHIHAPQWPQLGTGLDLRLEDWLFQHTFPLEARFVDETFAKSVWADLVPTLLSHGTTTAVYFGPRDRVATTSLAETCAAQGQRAFVGRTAMDHPDGTPIWYRDESATASVAESAASVEEIRALGSALVQPIVTPRFIPACTDAALSGLAELATQMDVRVQTHCSESDWEHNHVLDRCGRSDTEALEAFGLLARSTVLAHGNFMSDADLMMAHANGAGVAHCPLSNTYFANAVFPARRALDLGTLLGLGTDVAGGASPGLLPQCAHAVSVSRHLEDGVNTALGRDVRGVAGSRIDVVEAFWMATMGGADLLDIPVGLLEPGRRFDAIAVRPSSVASGLHRWPEIDDDVSWFEKIVRLATPGDISHVWVEGERVAGSEP